jgi:hypothetical protein
MVLLVGAVLYRLHEGDWAEASMTPTREAEVAEPEAAKADDSMPARPVRHRHSKSTSARPARLPRLPPPPPGDGDPT